MRPARLLPALALVGCSTELIGPEDPRFDDACVLYVEEDQPAEISRWMLEHCETVLVLVVTFEGAVLAAERVSTAGWEEAVDELLERVRNDRELEVLNDTLELEPEETTDFEREVLYQARARRRGPMPVERTH